MNETIENIIGNIVEINNRRYIISEGYIVTPDGSAVKYVDHFGVKLIALDKLSKPTQEVPPKEKIKGISLELNEEQMYNKIYTVKAIMHTFNISLIESKRLVDSIEKNIIKIPLDKITGIDPPMHFLKNVIASLEEHLPKNNFTASFYY